jgi:hypothetical protein
MLSLSFGGTDKQVLESLRLKFPRILEALRVKMDALNIALQAKIVGQKLSGQVLQHRTGKLGNSIRVIPAKIQGQSSIIGSVEGAGGPAFYGRFHEFGTSRSYTIVPVNKKALAFALGGGKELIVKSVLHPPIKERSFLRSSQKEMQAQIISGLQDALNKVIAQP